MRLETQEERIRAAAKRRPKQRLTSLMHHIYDRQRLERAFYSLRRDAAVGVDGVTWKEYAQNLDENLDDLRDRLARGGYRPEPVRRTTIPKADGKSRPLGIPAVEDKIVQRSAAEVLGCIYEVDFLGFSYGFRPGRNQHQALDAVSVGIERKKVNHILDADIQKFFETLDHGWLIRFVEDRVGDPRVIRLLKKWLHAGVLEAGQIVQTETGTPQGGIISPLLANIYLHYAFDLWIQHWRTREGRGEVMVVRFADDFVIGFERRTDARAALGALRERLAGFGLTLHPEKTRLIAFGRYAAERRQHRGAGRPETFTFLGFEHMCSETKAGDFWIRRQTSMERMRRRVKEVREKLRRRRHAPPDEVGKWLKSVLEGHYRYFSVPGNRDALRAYRRELVRGWFWELSQRSQKARWTWKRMRKLIRKFLPTPSFVHPYPSMRLRVNSQGRSPVR